MQKGAAKLTGCSFYFCLFLRYHKISVFTNHAVAIAVIPKIAFIDQLYAKIVGIRMGKLPENGWITL